MAEDGMRIDKRYRGELATGKGRVLITGGAGFLGRGILRRAKEEGWLSDVVIFSRDETKQDAVKRRFPGVKLVLGDVRDARLLQAAMTGVSTVIHAAAIKYIPEAEVNVTETIGVNVDGTATVLGAAGASGVSRVVCLSTDKATRPVNAYGMSKALVERLVGEASRWYSHMNVGAVRYGNVVGSTGSVIEKWVEEARNGETLMVTNPDMTRFWLSVDMAIDLIEVACHPHHLSGSTIIPILGSMRMGALADMLAGDNAWREVGARPGEKVHEELMAETEAAIIRQRNGFYEHLSPSAGIVPDGDGWTTPHNLTSDIAPNIDRRMMAEWIGDAESI